MSQNSPGKYQTAISRFRETVQAFPGRPALEKGAVILTYQELSDLAQDIELQLRASGDDRPFVAVVADKSPECYASILGIMMAGKGYLPLNPRFPAQRNEFMMQKAGVRSIVEGGKVTTRVC